MKSARLALLISFVIFVNAFTAAIIVSFVDTANLPDWLFDFGAIVLGLAVLVAIACIVFACVTHRKAAVDLELQKGLGLPVVIAKLLMIPFFLLGAATVVLFFFASFILTLSIKLAPMGVLFGAGSVVFVLFLSVINYLFILATSSFSISSIIIEYRQRSIKLSTTVIFVILQLLPITDVISYIFIGHYFKGMQKLRAGNQGTPPPNQAPVQPPSYPMQ